MISRQGKAIVQLPYIELATDFVSLCESECVKLNGALAIHPSYCVLSKPREIRTSEAENISETMDGMVWLRYSLRRIDYRLRLVYCLLSSKYVR